MPPRIKYTKQGRPYYDYGWGGKASEFTDAFVKGMAIAQEMGDKEEARRQRRRQEREAFNSLRPEKQEEFIKGATAQDLVDLGLVIRKGDTIPQGPVEPGEAPLEQQQKTYATGKGPFKKEYVLRPGAIRDKTLEEKAADEVNTATIQNALKGSNLDIALKEANIKATDLQLRSGEFHLSKDKEDDATKKRYMASGIPILMSIATGRPTSEFHEAKLREKFPEQADLQDQMTYKIGPQARNAGYLHFREEGGKKFLKDGDAEKWAEAMTSAMYDADFTLLRALPENMMTYAMKQLQYEGERLELGRAQMLQSQQHFIEQEAKSLMLASNFTINMDTAVQYVKKHTFGAEAAPMSPEAAKQMEGFMSVMEGQRQTAQATAYYDLQAKKGKEAREAREGLRSSITTLLAMHKQDIGGKPLEQQMLAIKDELIKKEAAELGIDLSSSSGQFWSDSIWNAAKATVGGLELTSAVMADANVANMSLGGRIVRDTLPPQMVAALEQYGEAQMQGMKSDMGQIPRTIDYLTSPTTVVDWTMSGTKLGEQLKEKFAKTPVVRILYQENLKASQLKWKTEIQASQDPLVVEDRLKKIDEVSKILRGMGLQ